MLAVALAVALLALLVAGAVAYRALTAWRTTALRRRVVVNLRSGRAVEGILFERAGPLLVLKSARLHDAGSAPIDVDGDVVLERSVVDFVQVLPSAEG